MRSVIQPEFVAEALSKATHPDQKAPLEDIARLVAAVDERERTYGTRIDEARKKAGFPHARLSRAAKDAVDVSADAGRDLDRLLARYCRRATTAVEVIQVLATAAHDDLEASQILLEGDPNDPAHSVARTLVQDKMDLLSALEAFLERFRTATNG